MKHRIRTRKQPTVVLEVEGPEYLDLLRQGLVLPEPPAPVRRAPATPAEAPAKVAPQKEN